MPIIKILMNITELNFNGKNFPFEKKWQHNK
jgi:hypothetical protein